MVIAKSSNNQEKYITYKELIKKLKIAINNGFFFEAITIEYALLEDTTDRIIYGLGLKNTKETKKKSKKKLIKEYIEFLNINRPSISKMYKKIELIKATIERIDDCSLINNKYVELLRKIINKKKLKFKLSVFDEILNWCSTRNEIIHASLKKEYNNLIKATSAAAKNGEELFRELDYIARKIKDKALDKLLKRKIK